MRLTVWCAQKVTIAGPVYPNWTTQALQRLIYIWELKSVSFLSKRIRARKNPHPNETHYLVFIFFTLDHLE